MEQTELTVFLTLAATFGQTGFLVGYQVSSSEHPFCLVRVSSGKPAVFPYNGYRHRWCSGEHPGSVLPPLLNMSFPERLSLFLMLVNLFDYGIPQM